MARENRNSTGMSRSAFLGVTAGATAALGSWPLAASAALSERQVSNKLQRCAQNLQSFRWAVPASVLNYFWGDLFPRVVAAFWTNELSPPAQCGDCKKSVQAWIEYFVGNPDTSSNYPNTGTYQASAEFGRRMQLLWNYLKYADDKTIPLTYDGEGTQFDFALSEKGINFYSPSLEAGVQGRQALRRQYTFRGTGRAPIGFPGIGPEYMIDSPTGPSQVKVFCPKVMAVLLNEHPLAAESVNAFCDGPESVRENVLRVVGPEVIGSEERSLYSDQERAARMEEVFTYVGFSTGEQQALREVLRSGQPFIPKRERALAIVNGYLGSGEPRGTETCETPGMDADRCAKKIEDCWMLEGSVYRGIIEQFPRVAAQHLYDENLAATTPVQVPSLRAKMETRLETSLPTDAVMHFDTTAATLPGDGGDLDDMWLPGSLMISNKGIHFPTVPSMSRNGMLDEIKNGRAGNPVFTDSRRST